MSVTHYVPAERSQVHWYIHTGYPYTRTVNLIERDTSDLMYALSESKYLQDIYGQECCWTLVF